MRWLMFALLVTVPGCKQGPGDRCNVDSDCDDSQMLICVRMPQATPQSGGVCQLPGGLPTMDLSSPDGGENVDLAEINVDL